MDIHTQLRRIIGPLSIGTFFVVLPSCDDDGVSGPGYGNRNGAGGADEFANKPLSSCELFLP
jgi:hypothetical protein